MKKTIIVFLFLAFMSCQDNSVPKKQATYTSIEGDWVISGPVTGTFTVLKVGSDYVVDHGSFKFDGKSFPIAEKRAVENEPGFLITLFLLHDNDNSVVIRSCAQDLVNFRSLTPQLTDCYFNGGLYESYTDVKVTR